VVGYSKTIINHVVYSLVLIENPLDSIIARRKDVCIFNKIKYYHAMWENNCEANWWENHASTLKYGEIMVNAPLIKISSLINYKYGYKDMY
jgi:hypothetical protein